MKSGKPLFAPPLGKLNFLYAARNDPNLEEANTIIALGLTLQDPTTDKNIYHASHAHAQGGLLREAAKQQGVTPSGELQECQGSPTAKGLRQPIKSFGQQQELSLVVEWWNLRV